MWSGAAGGRADYVAYAAVLVDAVGCEEHLVQIALQFERLFTKFPVNVQSSYFAIQ